MEKKYIMNNSLSASACEGSCGYRNVSQTPRNHAAYSVIQHHAAVAGFWAGHGCEGRKKGRIQARPRKGAAGTERSRRGDGPVGELRDFVLAMLGLRWQRAIQDGTVERQAEKQDWTENKRQICEGGTGSHKSW